MAFADFALTDFTLVDFALVDFALIDFALVDFALVDFALSDFALVDFAGLVSFPIPSLDYMSLTSIVDTAVSIASWSSLSLSAALILSLLRHVATLICGSTWWSISS